MSGLKKTIIRAGLETLYFSGAHVALRPFFQGVGAILTLHHVRPPRRGALPAEPAAGGDAGFPRRRDPQPAALAASISSRSTKCTAGWCERDFKRRFVCITFDDGYRDKLQYAYPILKKHEVPFALYVPTSFPDRIGELWWLALERVVANNDRIGLYDRRPRAALRLRAPSTRSATSTSSSIGGCAASRPRTNCARRSAIWRRATVSTSKAFCDELCMTWEDIAELSRDPLVTIGAHTVNHSMLKKTSDRVGALRNGNEPRRDRVGDRHPARAFRLSGRRSDLGGPARIRASPPNSASRPR